MGGAKKAGKKGHAQKTKDPTVCAGCKVLLKAIGYLQEESRRNAERINAAQNSLDLMKGSLESMQTSMDLMKTTVEKLKKKDPERMNRVMLHILLEQAQQKALQSLGYTEDEVLSWKAFFDDHGAELKELHEISDDAINLLKVGKLSLNDNSTAVDIANGILNMEESMKKVHFTEVFDYVFGCLPKDLVADIEF